MWTKTSENLPPRNVPVLAAWRHGAAWNYNVVKFGGRRWLDVIPDDEDDWQYSTPDYWRAIEAPCTAAETSAALGRPERLSQLVNPPGCTCEYVHPSDNTCPALNRSDAL